VHVVTSALLILLGLVVLVATADAYQANVLPTLDTARTATGIRVDGRLDDPGWRTAGRADNFTESWPGDNVEPPVRTLAWLTYDEDNLYVAFECFDDPASLRATMSQRDEYGDDDAVGVLIDTYGDATWAYEFYVNPYGIQRDNMWTSVQGSDQGFDMVWQSAAHVTADGYVVEMAIPLAGMRFPDGEAQRWRVDFRRQHPRESDRTYAWAARDRDEQCQPCQWGVVNGIAGVRPGKGLELLPSFIGYRTGQISDWTDSAASFHDNDVEQELSFGAKYSPSSAVTVEGTYNPDFSQIEADADQIDVNTTIVQRFAERRPFFQEGNDLFRTYFNAFYTRMVNDPQLATKVTARLERTSFAYMLARDENSPYIAPAAEQSHTTSLGRSTVQVLRGLHSFGTGQQLGFMATDRRYDEGGVGEILSGDFNLRLSQTYSWIGQLVWSRTEEPEGVVLSAGETFDDGAHTIDLDGESYDGLAFITQLRRSGSHWNLTLDYNQLDPRYRTQTGYDPWNDQRNAYVWTGYNVYPEGGLVERLQLSLFANGRWNMAGDNKWRNLNPQLSLNLRKAQSWLGMGYNAGEETWFGDRYAGLWRVYVDVITRPRDDFGFYVGVRFAHGPALAERSLGEERALSFECDYKPWDRLIIEPTFDWIRSESVSTGELLFEQAITRARFRFQASPRLSVRLVVQHNATTSPLWRARALAGDFPTYHRYFGGKWEVDPLLTYRINSFSVFYLGSTHDWRDFNAADDALPNDYVMTGRQFFTKLQYLFQM
jgi:hypothetical protein